MRKLMRVFAVSVFLCVLRAFAVNYYGSIVPLVCAFRPVILIPFLRYTILFFIGICK